MGATLLGVWRYRQSGAETYLTGEAHTEVTRRLARDLPDDAPVPRFSDVTAEAGLEGFRTFTGERTSQLPEDMGPGAAWGDVDNDGDQDLFLVSAGGPLDAPAGALAPSLLYENLGNGTFRPAPDFPDLRISGMGAAFGDADGDGWLDLVVTGFGTLQLLRNDQGRFVADPALSVPELEHGFWAGAAWGDFDNDRDLDLYVCGYVRYTVDDADRARASTQYGRTVPFTLNPATYDPERNLLFRNEGGGRFTEVADAFGVANPEGRSLTALWHDFDGDGWLDLYVANDVSDNVLYMNWDGTFEDTSHAAWVADYRGAMGLAAGDWNRDGDDDLFITHWVAQENALYDSLGSDFTASSRPVPDPGDPGGEKPTAARTGRGQQFMDVANQRGLGQIALQRVGWGTEFVDLDGDGWLDLVVANGSTFETQTPPRRLEPQVPFLFWNRRGEYFHDLATLHERWAEPAVGRGVAVADYDGDGDQDVLMVRLGAGVRLLRNEMQTGHWLQLRLRSRQAGPAELAGWGDGATVVARAGNVVLRRSVSSASYLSQSSRVVHLGLGTATRVDTLDVRWRGDEVTSYRGLEADTTWELTEGDPEPRRLAPSARPAKGPREPPPVGSAASTSREQLMRFWAVQREAVDAMRIEQDLPRAITLFREALAIDPSHEDSRYYLGNCLAQTGDVAAALDELAELARLDPQSHRAHRQWGLLRAMSARSVDDLTSAEAALQRALALNPEETGSLLLLGEVALLRGQPAEADRYLTLATRTNARAVGGFFLRAYLAWRANDAEAARRLLTQAREARGQEWMPRGATSEGDVARRMHADSTPLSRFWETWEDGDDLGEAFGALDAHLTEAER